MKENIKEDIKLLEEMRENCRTKRDYIDIKAERKATAIDDILSDYKRVLKENEELKRTNKVISIELTKDKILQQDCLRTVCGVPIGEIPKILRENEELKHKYDKALSDVIAGVDLDNTYIPVQKVKDKLEKYKKISNELYIKFLESDRYDTNIRDKGIKCDAVVQVLQELLEEE